MNQPLPSKDERIVSANPYPDAAITGHSDGAIRGQPGSSIAVAANNASYQLNAYPSVEHYYYGGYDNNSGSWGGYPQYASAEGLQIHPVMYGDNSALGLHSVYGFNSQMTYGQYSPVSTPVPHMVMDNQIFSPQQAPFSPSYYPQAVASSMPHMSATGTVSQDSLSYKGNHSVESGSSVGYYSLHGMYGVGEPSPNTSNHAELSQRTMSPVTSTGPYAQSIGTFGSYDLNAAHASQQSQMSGYGLPSDFLIGQYAYDASNQSSTFAYPSNPQPAYNYPGQLYLEKGRNHREQVPSSVVPGDRNRGPRALKVKLNGNTESSAVSGSGKIGASVSGVQVESFNRSDLPAEPENAKFFIIKSFSEDNVHRSIKYGVWASTLHGNRKLDDAYRQAKESGNCPVYLFYSVNASSQFCGVAEMVGPLDFEKNADYWQQDRWNGQFPVIWHILKDVPNSKFRHILLENNDNKPVTHSRDSQEVELEHGIEMLKIFKEHEATTSILDDFEFYDERERLLQERKNRQVGKSKSEAPEPINASIVNDISDRLDQALQLEDDDKK